MVLLQLECNRKGTSLAVLELCFVLGKMVSVFSNPGLLKIHHDKPRRHECLPVVRKRPMKPDELRFEMGPRRIRAFPLLEVRETPAIPCLFTVFRNCGTPLRKAWMGENENRHTAGSQNSVESFHGLSKVRDIHENVVRDHHVKMLIIDCA